MFKPFISSKFYRKIHYYETVELIKTNYTDVEMYLPNWLVDYEQGIIKDRSTVIEEVKDENYSIDLEKYVYFNNSL